MYARANTACTRFTDTVNYYKNSSARFGRLFHVVVAALANRIDNGMKGAQRSTGESRLRGVRNASTKQWTTWIRIALRHLPPSTAKLQQIATHASRRARCEDKGKARVDEEATATAATLCPLHHRRHTTCKRRSKEPRDRGCNSQGGSSGDNGDDNSSSGNKDGRPGDVFPHQSRAHVSHTRTLTHMYALIHTHSHTHAETKVETDQRSDEATMVFVFVGTGFWLGRS
ncbi:hypothetical protein V9T40_009722 [Parthenolecanium corni]|uniref:Uncharacterized protein n=1 Tax=Parthenolecanium corni TaxID=536013 RepID=A0AAN9TSW1_9HEMI